MNFQDVFNFFIFYSFLGWVSEVIYCSLLNKRIVKRGVLYLPLCPIYGFGACFIIFLLRNWTMNPLLLFIFGMLGATIIEYIGHVILEKVFLLCLWDYTSKRIHLQGRVCLLNSLLFGIMSLVTVYLIHPLVESFYLRLFLDQKNVFTLILGMLFGIDLSIFVLSAILFNQTEKHMQGFSSFVYRRFLERYPNIQSFHYLENRRIRKAVPQK